MNVDVEIRGLKKLEKRLKKIVKDSQKELEDAVTKSAYLVEGAAKTKVQRGPATGRIYTRDGISHQASSKGEAPATDTGTLVSSITHDVNKLKLTAVVGSNVEYAKFLEFGTVHMDARPFLYPALEENRNKIMRLFKAAMADAVKKKR